MLTAETLRRLEQVRDRHSRLRSRFHAGSEGGRDELLRAVGDRRDDDVDEALTTCPEGGLTWLADATITYLRHCDWELFDPLSMAVAVAVGAETAVEALAGPVLVHQSWRMIDDVVNDYHSFKDKYETLFGFLLRHYDAADARALTLMVAELLALRGARWLGDRAAEDARRPLVGTALEAQAADADVGTGDFLAFVDHKLVSQSRLLYRSVLEAGGYPFDGATALFLDTSSTICQMVSDLEDTGRDAGVGRHNFWSVFGEGSAEVMLARFAELEALSCELPGDLTAYAHARIGDLAQITIDVARLLTRWADASP